MLLENRISHARKFKSNTMTLSFQPLLLKINPSSGCQLDVLSSIHELKAQQVQLLWTEDVGGFPTDGVTKGF
jgi:hypothetical protein